MITVISGTNRSNSNTIKVARRYFEYLELKGQEVKLLDLCTLPADFVHSKMYGEPTEAFHEIEKQFLYPAEKFVMVMPEYNGSFPGILKLLIDGSDIKKAFYFKKVSLTGVSSGRAGCLRGLDSLTNMLNYIKMEVLLNKIPISGIGALLGEDGSFAHEATLQVMHEQMDQFIAY